MCRYRRLARRRVCFLTGTDEHGDKIAQAAAEGRRLAAGATPTGSRRPSGTTWRRARHHQRRLHPHDRAAPPEGRAGDPAGLYDAGEIYFGKYGGWYCFGCERFYTEKEIVDGKCPDHQTPLTFIEEKNYFFKMSKYQELADQAPRGASRLHPARALSQRGAGLPARAAAATSRSAGRRRRLQWGIPLPFDDQYVTYVWFDALINYVSALGRPGDERFETFWPHVAAPDRQGHPEAARGLLADHAEGGRHRRSTAASTSTATGRWAAARCPSRVGNVVEALRARRQVRQRRLPLLPAARDDVRPRRGVLARRRSSAGSTPTSPTTSAT